MKFSGGLNFPRRKVERYGGVFKIFFVRSVAEGFVVGSSTTAERDDRSALKSVSVALSVNNLEVALYFDGAVGVDENLC